MSHHLDRILDFWCAWDRLSEEGACDSTGGMESRRVFEEWMSAGQPTQIGEFIPLHANRIPDVKK